MVAHSACRQKVKTGSKKNSGKKVRLVLMVKLGKKPQNNKSAVPINSNQPTAAQALPKI